MRKIWVLITLFFIVPALLTFVSCGSSQQTASTADDMAAQEELERQKEEEARRLEEERQQKLAEEQRLKEEAMEQAKTASREKFVNEDVYFNFDSAVLLPQSQQVLRVKAEWLNMNSGESVLIEGHCDERGTDAYNLALGEKRAEAVKTFLVNLGVSASRLSTISYGEERPIDLNHNDAAWAKNRRAHFTLD